jgi:hypothetical protein
MAKVVPLENAGMQLVEDHEDFLILQPNYLKDPPEKWVRATGVKSYHILYKGKEFHFLKVIKQKGKTQKSPSN